jgi:RHS repeat-associated protein
MQAHDPRIPLRRTPPQLHRNNLATAAHSTGKERDAESGNDYFGARYYASTMGRWLSPDWSAKEEPVPYAKLDDPQSLNLYSYVGNNPLVRVDADGHVAGADDLVEGVIVVGVIGAIALEAGAQAYNRSPEGQRSLETFTSGVSESFSSSVNSVKSTISGWFSKKAAPLPADSTAKPQGPVKAADAPGVTAGGQATDEHGRKLGPSGKPQVNNVPKNTREGAKNTGNKGGGTVEHPNPKDGSEPHFHTTRGDGTKVQDNTHYTYPK